MEDLSAVAVVAVVVVVAGLRSGTNPVSEQGKVAPKNGHLLNLGCAIANKLVLHK